MYRSIDQVKTGLKLKMMLKMAGYDVRYVQEYLHLSCPQSIYRWFKGKILPSLDHLYALSQLMGVHMEDLLVPEGQQVLCYEDLSFAKDPVMRRLYMYAIHLKKAA